MLGLAAGISSDAVTIDRDHRRASAVAAPLPGATVAAYRALEQRTHADMGDWEIAITPPQGPLPLITFADDADALDAGAREAVLTSAWAAKRWNMQALAVPGLVESPPERPTLSQRRAAAIAAILRDERVTPLSAPAAGQSFRLIRSEETTQ